MDVERFPLQLFDLDDTLLHTRASYYAAQEYAVDELWDRLLLPQRERAYQEIHWFSKRIGSVDPPAYMSAFLQSWGILNDANLRLLLECYRESYWSDIKLYEGALEFLEKLQTQGRQLGLVSNGTSSTQHKKVMHTGLGRFFPAAARFISGDFEPRHKKPSPYMILRALEYFGREPSETIYYGNTQDDVLAANLAGVTSLLFGPEETEETAPQAAKPVLRRGSWLGIVKPA
ncbi:MAG: HAD hydrolase-like protein [bacterium]|nr:HAD hydrolase-like protein [bacterium]